MEGPPVLLGRGGGLTYAQGPHVTKVNFFGRVQMYDGCCSVCKVTTKKSPERVTRILRAKVTTTKKGRRKIEGQLLWFVGPRLG